MAGRVSAGRVCMTRSAYSLEAKRKFAADLRQSPTRAEQALWERLRARQTGFVFHRQSVQRGYILDFYCPRLRLAVEVDGSVHRLQAAADAQREQALRQRGVKLLRFTNREVLECCSWVMKQITAATA